MSDQLLSRLKRDHPEGLTPPKLARAIGVSHTMVHRRIVAKMLPVLEHGPKKRLVQWDVISLIRRYGLNGVQRMVEAGQL